MNAIGHLLCLYVGFIKIYLTNKKHLKEVVTKPH